MTNPPLFAASSLATGLTGLRLALDATVLRQQAAAANLANIHTPGYQPVRVRFDTHLQQAGGPGSAASTGLRDQTPQLERTAGPVVTDRELTALSLATLQYQILLKIVNSRLDLTGLAINDGRSRS